MDTVDEFMNQEETIKAMIESWDDQDRAAGRKRSFPWENEETKNSNNRSKAPGVIVQKNHTPTPLNTAVTEIFMKIKRDLDFSWPPKMRAPPQSRSK